MAKDNLTD